MKRWSTYFVLLAFARAPWSVAQRVSESAPADRVLTGEAKGEQHQTYFEIPVTVPEGVHRISVDFQYTGKDQRALH